MTMGMLESSEGETMELSADQIRAVASGEAVSITVEQTPCVLIRADLYDRVRALLDIEAAYPLIDETFQEGWDAPGMSDYDRYDELKRP
jgi:antitoxin (DNA-binding transcriptional repressor) of toxin-antitoxin stability system